MVQVREPNPWSQQGHRFRKVNGENASADEAEGHMGLPDFKVSV